MRMASSPVSITDWNQVAVSNHPGESGFALWKTLDFSGTRLRMVEYSPGYVADHWCSRGHVILCLSGDLKIELEDGRRLVVAPGQSCQLGEASPHRTSSASGAQLFIVD